MGTLADGTGHARGVARTLGRAVFVTHDGLTAEGDGWLSSIPDHVSLIEFRDHDGKIEHLPPRGVVAFFATPLRVEAEEVTLVGILTRETDAMHRPGFMGVAEAHKMGTFAAANLKPLLAFFHAGHKHYREVFRQTRHSAEIGMLNRDPRLNYHLEAVGEPLGDDIFIRGATAQDEAALMMRLLALVGHTRRRTLVWNTDKGPYPDLAEEKRRAPNPRFPRPVGITVEHEDYLIGLIERVLSERGRALIAASPATGKAHSKTSTRGSVAAGADFSTSFGRSWTRRPSAFLSSNWKALIAVGFVLIVPLFAFYVGPKLLHRDGGPDTEQISQQTEHNRPASRGNAQAGPPQRGDRHAEPGSEAEQSP